MHFRRHQLSIVCSYFTSVSIHEVVFLFLVISSVQALENAVNNKICGDIDIRNSIKQFERLENCTVIEGVVQILLIDQAEPSHFSNLSFPKLREITGFLLLYRVYGLTTLANLFPNLAVIRGAKLFRNSALIIYEMMSLQEIGLPSLTVILRGSVHIERNPQLCYVNTIDWEVIASKGKDDIFIKENKEINQCPNNCPSNCPVKTHDGEMVPLCWNKNTCQKLCTHCPNNACMKSGDGKGKCCYDQCLGGCEGDDRSDCFACTTVVYKGKCLRECHPGTYKFANRRCITDVECLRMNKKTIEHGKGKEVIWKLFNNTCVSECPEGYIADEHNATSCVKCNGSCPKECESITIDSISTAQALQGCTRIKGHLEIHIKGGANIVQELEENLVSLKEVDDYVRITRSFPLMSLNFLKNLEKIHGKKKDNSQYSLYVFENNNLQELIPAKNHSKLEIASGKVFFHNNPKLCKNKIEAFLNMSNFTDYDAHDVSPVTNGDRVACTVRSLQAFVETVTSTGALVKWENFKQNITDQRSLIGYVISYKEAKDNVSMYDGRDACGADTWNVEDVRAELNYTDSGSEMFLLMNLKPYTRYAVYVKTYTIATAESELGAQSSIIYFRTHPDVPSSPLDVKVYSLSPDSLIISWLPPSKPNGTITHYIVRGFNQTYDQEYLYQRDYCETPIILTAQTKEPPLTPFNIIPSNTSFAFERPSSSPVECCECPRKTSLINAAKELEDQINFEDALHNYVYVKRDSGDYFDSSSKRDKRAVGNGSIPMNELTTLGPLVISTSVITNNPLQPLRRPAFIETANSTKIKIVNLKHFSAYSIEIEACQDSFKNKKKLCSAKAITTATTARKGMSDDINSNSMVINVLNDTAGKVFIRWKEPEDPNGLIVTYHLEYKKMNIKNFKAIPVCITQKQYLRDRGYTLVNLDAGNYSIRIHATSLAGNGNWTEAKFFVIIETTVGVNTEVIIVSVVVSVAVLFIIVIGGIFFMKKYIHKIPDGILYASVNPEYMSTGEVYVPDEWEMPRDKITLIRELGQGSFGMVYEGIVKDFEELKPEIRCAIKTVNETASVRERIEFLNEASVMKAFNCPHVVKLIGVVSKGQPTLVVMELMANGDLKSYLRLHRPDSEAAEKLPPPTLKRILQMACEIADGMAYLAAKKFVHRDLAARNCMVAENLTVKIGDFGMTRDIYETDYYRKGGKGLLPVRWMAPESLKDGVFTSQSDVWSYGIVLWEMATLASQPYQGLSNEQVLKYVIDGGIMEKPENCPDRLYSLMGICWSHNPKNRPTFMELVNLLVADASPTFHQFSFYSTQICESSSYDVVDVDEVLPTTPLKNNVHTSPQVVESAIQNGPERKNHLSDDANKDCYIQTTYPIKNATKENAVHADEGNIITKPVANGHISFPFANNAEC